MFFAGRLCDSWNPDTRSPSPELRTHPMPNCGTGATSTGIADDGKASLQVEESRPGGVALADIPCPRPARLGHLLSNGDSLRCDPQPVDSTVMKSRIQPTWHWSASRV